MMTEVHMAKILVSVTILGEKGSSKSGNYGHAGRPGKLGGSAVRGSTSFGSSPFEQAAQAHAFEQFQTMYGFSQQDMERMFAYGSYDSKMTMQIDGTVATLEVNYFDPNTHKRIGNCIRTFNTNPSGKWVMNDNLEFKSGYMNTGAARSLYKRELRMLQQAGYDHVSVHADISIGKYAWAKQGFDFKSSSAAADASKQIVQWAQMHGITIKQPNFKTARDVATFKVPKVKLTGADILNGDVPNGMKLDLGKAFMLDNKGLGDWNGIYRFNQ
jgi:hypothetical protein